MNVDTLFSFNSQKGVSTATLGFNSSNKYGSIINSFDYYFLKFMVFKISNDAIFKPAGEISFFICFNDHFFS